MGTRAANDLKVVTACGISHLGQAELHAGDMRRDHRHVHAQRLCGIEDARTVQVDWQALRGLPSQLSLQLLQQLSTCRTMHLHCSACIREVLLHRPGAVVQSCSEQTCVWTRARQPAYQQHLLQQQQEQDLLLSRQGMCRLRTYILNSTGRGGRIGRAAATAGVWHGAPALTPTC